MRAGTIIYNPKEKEVLLIHRLKNGREYWVNPGGTVEENESALEAAIRETHEEINLKLSPQDLTPFVEFQTTKKEVYFLTELLEKSEFEIHGEEKERSSENNIYQPTWVPISEFQHIELVPEELKKSIVEKLK